MEKLNLELIEGMVDRTPVSGVCLLQTYSKAPTKNGGFYMGGTLSTSDGSIPFKAWGSSDCFKTLDETDLKGSIIMCIAEVNIFNGQRSLIVSSIRVLNDEVLAEMGLTQTDFMYSKYNVDAYWEKFDKTMERICLQMPTKCSILSWKNTVSVLKRNSQRCIIMITVVAV